MDEDYVAKLKRQHRRNEIIGAIVAIVGIATVAGLSMLRAVLMAVHG